jgi:hypothetical protein
VADNTQVRQLFRDATSGKLNRREVFQRGIALGLSANVIGMLALNAVKVPSAFAAEEGKPSGTFYDWMLNLHPTITTSATTASSRRVSSRTARGTSTAA